MGEGMTLLMVEEVKGKFSGRGFFLQKYFDKICLKAARAFFPICGL